MLRQRTREMFSSATLRLVVLEEVEIRQDHGRQYHQVYGKLEPKVLIVYGADGVFALDMHAKPVDVDTLLEELG
jgi:hypothetical protein